MPPALIKDGAIILKGNYGWRDMLKAHRLHEGIAEIFFLPLIMLFFVVPPMLRANGEVSDLVISGGVILFFTFTLVSVFHFGIQPLQIRRRFQKEPPANQYFEFLFDQEGIEVVKDFGRIKQSWDLITHFRENSDLFILYPKDRGYIALPKREMSKADMEQIRALLSKHSTQNRNPFGEFKLRLYLLVVIVGLLVMFQVLRPT